MDILSGILSFTFLAQIFRMMTPYYLGASGANFSERAGVINISIEGFMNMAAFSFAVFSIFTGNSILALVLCLIVNIILSIVFSLFTVTLKINQIGRAHV